MVIEQQQDGAGYYRLPRGGVLIPTSIGNLQLGVPPETIKDTMVMAGGVPQVFILPQYLFDLTRGIALAELEFPIYFNFFIKKQKTRVVCGAAQLRRIEVVVSEAMFGPAQLDIINEFVNGAATPGFPDLRAEMNYFRALPPATRPIVLDDLVEFIEFDKEGRAQIGPVEIRLDDLHNLNIVDPGGATVVVARQTPLFGGQVEKAAPDDFKFRPPLFGITTLGAGHGFDPDANTSGLLIWLNRRGVVVDPPVNSIDHLLRLGVSPKLIDSVILTHCHADHDAGTLQKILREDKLNLYTTETIFNSFMRKSAALTGIDEEHLRKLVNFYPVLIGEATNICGGAFQFNYTLHSIPTVSISVAAYGKSMMYSSDTLNDPRSIDRLYGAGVISKSRRDFLADFPWNHTVILHEAGMPPLHTPLEYLCGLPEEIRKRMFLVHVDQKMIPKDSGLRTAPTGLASTLELAANSLPHEGAIELLDVLAHNSLFQSLSIGKAREFLLIARQESYDAGEVIFRPEDAAERLYIIVSGQVDIVANDQVLATYSNCDCFGERVVFPDEKHTTAAIARTALRLLWISGWDLLSFIRGSESADILSRIAVFQDRELRAVFDASRLLRSLTPAQQTQLMGWLKPIPGELAAGSELVSAGSWPQRCYIIQTGEVDVYQDGVHITTRVRGDLLGIPSLFGADPPRYDCVARTALQLYGIDRRAMVAFLDKNPGVYIKFFHYKY